VNPSAAAAPVYLKLNPVVKAAWLEALRSGDYKQGRERLHRINDDGSSGYCCMGVLCELAIGSMPVYRYQAEDEWGDPVFSYDGDDSYPPVNVMQWANLDRTAQFTLSRLNDDEVFNFSEIADWIEANL
jgi:hypothetical protein